MKETINITLLMNCLSTHNRNEKKIKNKVKSYDAPPLRKSKAVLKDTISFQN
jgi:hypothetical protein